jgi:hypothetical protein
LKAGIAMLTRGSSFMGTDLGKAPGAVWRHPGRYNAKGSIRGG